MDIYSLHGTGAFCKEWAELSRAATSRQQVSKFPSFRRKPEPRGTGITRNVWIPACVGMTRTKPKQFEKCSGNGFSNHPMEAAGIEPASQYRSE